MAGGTVNRVIPFRHLAEFVPILVTFEALVGIDRHYLISPTVRHRCIARSLQIRLFRYCWSSIFRTMGEHVKAMTRLYRKENPAMTAGLIEEGKVTR